jgi:hypothetical protein
MDNIGLVGPREAAADCRQVTHNSAKRQSCFLAAALQTIINLPSRFPLPFCVKQKSICVEIAQVLLDFTERTVL